MEIIGEPALVTTLRLRRGEVTCVDAVRSRLAAGSGDGTLRLWRWNRGLGWLDVAEQKNAHRYGITGAKFCDSGILLASIGIDGAARVWAVHDAIIERRTMAAPDAVAARSLQWMTSERLVVGHDNGGLRVWSVRSGALLCYVRPHEGAMYALATPGSGALLLTACTEGVLKVFDVEDVLMHGTEGGIGPTPLLWEDGAHDLGALCAVTHVDRAATGGHDGRIRMWRVQDAEPKRRVAADVTLSGHTAAVTALHWVHDVVASASLDRTARLWNPNSGTCLRVLHAHSRYLTCVAIADDLSFVVTGSNDKSIRTWSLGHFSLDEELEPDCTPLTHFGLGDLEGIGPVDDEGFIEAPNIRSGVTCASFDTRCIDRVPHAAAVNCVAVSENRLATACSDGWIRIFEWRGENEEGKLRLQLELPAHTYPALAVDFGANGALLFSAGLDGCARLWDVKSGCELVVLSADSLGAGTTEGGGGVRDVRISPHRPPLLLVTTDSGLAAVWSIDPPSAEPLHVYAGMIEAVTCCTWSSDGRVMVTGGTTGELRLLAPPPTPDQLDQEGDAHDLGVLSCDFAPNFDTQVSDDEDEKFLLATGGRDGSVKLWWVEVSGREGHFGLECTIAAHGGAVQCVRWAARALAGDEIALATGGADRWARVWRVSVQRGVARARAVAAVPAGAAGGAPAVRLLDGSEGSYLIVGALTGTLAVWGLTENNQSEETESAEARVWSVTGVIRWLHEYVTKVPGSPSSRAREERLERAACAADLTGARLLDEPVDDLLTIFECGIDIVDGDEEANGKETRRRLRDEIMWLRRDPLTREMEARAPHALRCPLSHRVLREPARAADGYTYERQNLLDWLVAVGAVVLLTLPEQLRSPMSGRRLRGARLAPNYGVRAQLREFCRWPPSTPDSLQ